MREEGRQRQQQQTGVTGLAGGLGGGVGGQQPQQNTGYSRYAQEKFNPKEGKWRCQLGTPIVVFDFIMLQ